MNLNMSIEALTPANSKTMKMCSNDKDVYDKISIVCICIFPDAENDRD
jgi:hypothetical protein